MEKRAALPVTFTLRLDPALADIVEAKREELSALLGVALSRNAFFVLLARRLIKLPVEQLTIAGR